MSAGFDTNLRLRQSQIKQIKAAGFDWVGRYYSFIGSYKVIQKQEAQWLTDNGIPIVAIFERAPVNVEWFKTSGNADTDVKYALECTQNIGQPKGGPVYFTVDYDAAIADLDPIGDYFTEVDEKIKAAGYLTGAYGSRRVLNYLFNKGVISYKYLCQSTGYADYAEAGTVNIKQGPSKGIELGAAPTSRIATLNVDLDEGIGTFTDFGAFLVEK